MEDTSAATSKDSQYFPTLLYIHFLHVKLLTFASTESTNQYGVLHIQWGLYARRIWHSSMYISNPFQIQPGPHRKFMGRSSLLTGHYCTSMRFFFFFLSFFPVLFSNWRPCSGCKARPCMSIQSPNKPRA